MSCDLCWLDPGRRSDHISFSEGFNSKPHVLLSSFLITSLLFTNSSPLMCCCLTSQSYALYKASTASNTLSCTYVGLGLYQCRVISSQLCGGGAGESRRSCGQLTEQDIQEIPAPPLNNKGKRLEATKRKSVQESDDMKGVEVWDPSGCN